MPGQWMPTQIITADTDNPELLVGKLTPNTQYDVEVSRYEDFSELLTPTADATFTTAATGDGTRLSQVRIVNADDNSTLAALSDWDFTIEDAYEHTLLLTAAANLKIVATPETSSATVTYENETFPGINGAFETTTITVTSGGNDRQYVLTVDILGPTENDYSLAGVKLGNDGDLHSDGITMWKADRSSSRAYAYDAVTKKRDVLKEFTWFSETDLRNRAGRGITGNNETLWISQSGSNDHILLAFSKDTLGRDAARDITLPSNVSANQIAAQGDFIYYRLLDAIRRVRISNGQYDNTFRIDLGGTLIQRGYSVQSDIFYALHQGGTSGSGPYTLRSFSILDNTLLAEVDLPVPPRIGTTAFFPVGIWTNGQLLWVCWRLGGGSDPQDHTMILAYDLEGVRQPSGGVIFTGSQDWAPLPDVETPKDITFTSDTMYVLDSAQPTIRAFRRSNKTRWPQKDFGTRLTDAGIQNATSVTNDGTTLWVMDNDSSHSRAFALADRSRDAAKDVPVSVGNETEAISVSDGEMWVAGAAASRVNLDGTDVPATLLRPTPALGEFLGLAVTGIAEDPQAVMIDRRNLLKGEYIEFEQAVYV